MRIIVLLQRLENQINDITELHQHEVTHDTCNFPNDIKFIMHAYCPSQVGELRANLAQMESMTMGKSQDLEEAMETCQTKVHTSSKLSVHFDCPSSLSVVDG